MMLAARGQVPVRAGRAGIDQAEVPWTDLVSLGRLVLYRALGMAVSHPVFPAEVLRRVPSRLVSRYDRDVDLIAWLDATRAASLLPDFVARHAHTSPLARAQRAQ